mmetsp:Transcript_6939/g.15206  ORF Transcript_6939/g.15206 Transcript_6939/m.15206 type:complete len:351 (-) Transcript_6939:74-1126(-)
MLPLSLLAVTPACGFVAGTAASAALLSLHNSAGAATLQLGEAMRGSFVQGGAGRTRMLRTACRPVAPGHLCYSHTLQNAFVSVQQRRRFRPSAAVRQLRTISLCMGSADVPLVRLDKLLADRGLGSRKDVDKLIRNGLVEIDGIILGKADGKRKVPWDCAPTVSGQVLAPPPLLAAYHKPVGVHSTIGDSRGRPSLIHVLPELWRKQMHPVGRLDADTSGLLLFSRDGILTHRMLHPKYEVEREYEATVKNTVDAHALGEKLSSGVATIEDGETYIVFGKLLHAEGNTVRLQVAEGKYRMVRRILANCGHPVLTLHRLRYGSVWLGDLEEGEVVPIEGPGLDWAKSLLAS